MDQWFWETLNTNGCWKKKAPQIAMRSGFNDGGCGAFINDFGVTIFVEWRMAKVWQLLLWTRSDAICYEMWITEENTNREKKDIIFLPVLFLRYTSTNGHSQAQLDKNTRKRSIPRGPKEGSQHLEGSRTSCEWCW